MSQAAEPPAAAAAGVPVSSQPLPVTGLRRKSGSPMAAADLQLTEDNSRMLSRHQVCLSVIVCTDMLTMTRALAGPTQLCSFDISAWLQSTDFASDEDSFDPLREQSSRLTPTRSRQNGLQPAQSVAL